MNTTSDQERQRKATGSVNYAAQSRRKSASATPSLRPKSGNTGKRRPKPTETTQSRDASPKAVLVPRNSLLQVTDVRTSPAGATGVRGSVLVALVLLAGTLLIAFAADALIRNDERMIVEILSFVKMFLSAVGGWTIGRSMR